MEADLAEAEQEQEQGKDAAARLTYEIFSILESKFLFGCDVPELLPSGAGPTRASAAAGKVCVLSIDGGESPVDGLLAGAALVRLEAALRRRAGSQAMRLADFFDVAAGSGAGGVLAAMLFARGPRGRPMYSAEDALGFLLCRVRCGWSARAGGLVRRPAAAAFGKAFGELTLRDTMRPVLVPCYDLATRAPFLFSRADAAESPAYNFRLRDVCAATCTGVASAAVEVLSVDGGTRIAAVGSGVVLGNPTAAAITHVLNNLREFPAAASIDDLLVMSIGTGEADRKANVRGGRAKPPEVARIAAEGVSDMVDQAVAMAFGHSRTTNYIRIQGTWRRRAAGRALRVACGGETKQQAVWKAEEMLLQKSVESVLFQGRKLAGETNAEKLERFACELANEHGRRKQQAAAPSPDRSSAATEAVLEQPTMARKAAMPSASAVAMELATEAPPRRRRRTRTNRAPATSRPDNNLVS
ncbi:patatin-like protein 3 [Phragmites australis]|uniref:patatin-like protein 3 n=1 Tax=Phragmites australis TaxID=29695 RepID=UPI002D781BC0|nr:patatin-like protein 3 [Phragmites australis]